jgi:salicylate hydroxylase
VTDIAIIGGGIGGLAAAAALRKAGYEPHIYERAQAFGEVGAGISLSPNAVKGLEWLGLEGFLAAHASEPLDQFVRHGETGETLLHFDRRDCRQRYGAAYYQLHRADLLAALAQHAGDRNFAFGRELRGLVPEGRGVTLAFADGSTASADVVIAADGLRSHVRERLFAAPPPRFSGHVAWRALIPSERLPPEYSAPASVNHVGAGRNLVTYPIRGGRLVNVVALTRATRWAEESWSARADPADLAAEFAGWTGYAGRAVAAIPDGALFRWGLFLRKPLDRWVSGSVALLGDAAHPMLPYMGQGASCAIEDAVVLGRCFAAESDPARALSRYEANRIGRATMLQAESNAGGERLQSLDPYRLRDAAPRHEDALGIFAYDPAAVALS